MQYRFKDETNEFKKCMLFSGFLRKKLNFDFVDNIDYHLDEEINSDLDEEEPQPSTSSAQKPPGSMAKSKRLKFNPNTSGGMGDNNLSSSPGGASSTSEFSPCRTRSGRIYIHAFSSAEKPPLSQNKKKSIRMLAKKSKDGPLSRPSACSKASPLPTPTFNQVPNCKMFVGGMDSSRPKELNLLQNDLSKYQSGDSEKRPPPLNYCKRPVSR